MNFYSKEMYANEMLQIVLIKINMLKNEFIICKAK